MCCMVVVHLMGKQNLGPQINPLKGGVIVVLNNM